MTTIGVKPAPSQRVMPMNIPNYSYMYPNTRVVQLAATKEGIYHPSLPTFRRMDMDTASNRLPDEHCRTTTMCTPEEFRKANMSLFTPPTKSLTTMGITETGRQQQLHYANTHENRNARLDWSTFLNKCPERYNIKLPKEPTKELHFTGYAVRYLRPEITNSWRYSLRQEPALDVHGQRPTPATAQQRHRNTSNTKAPYSRRISNSAFR